MRCSWVRGRLSKEGQRPKVLSHLHVGTWRKATLPREVDWLALLGTDSGVLLGACNSVGIARAKHDYKTYSTTAGAHTSGPLPPDFCPQPTYRTYTSGGQPDFTHTWLPLDTPGIILHPTPKFSHSTFSPATPRFYRTRRLIWLRPRCGTDVQSYGSLGQRWRGCRRIIGTGQ